MTVSLLLADSYSAAATRLHSLVVTMLPNRLLSSPCDTVYAGRYAARYRNSELQQALHMTVF
jgi:hypothetical protein